MNGCLTPNTRTDTCVLTRRNVNTSPRTHVLKTKENDTCIRCIENTGNRYMSSNLSKNSTKNPPTTCIEQTEMHDTCVLTNECAPGPNQSETSKQIHVYHRTAKTHRAERKLRQKQLGPQIVAVCYVYVFVPCLIWICRGLSQITIWKYMVACGLEMCKGVLSLPFVHGKRPPRMCEITYSLVSNTNSTIARILPFVGLHI